MSWLSRPGITTRRPRSMPSTAALAVSSELIHTNEGTELAASLSPLEMMSTNGVRTGPGQTAVVVTPVPLSSSCMASLSARTKALVAE